MSSYDSLSLDEIATLLKDDSIRPKPKQIGLLRYNREYVNCRVCGVVCGITIEGRPYCTTHALYAMNRYFVPDDVPEQCTCNAGPRTQHNLHTADCAIYDRLTDNAG